MKSHVLRPAVAAFVAVAFEATPAFAQAKRPNIIFILGDDLGPDCLGCCGSQKLAGYTP